MTQNYAKRTIIMHTQRPHTCKIPTEEALEAMTQLSSGAFKLLIYYYSKFTGWNFSDEEICKTLDVSTRRLKQLRKELVDKKYVYIQKGGIDVYFIGKASVEEWAAGQPSVAVTKECGEDDD